MNIIPEKAPKFSFNGMVVPARVSSVYDGDSVKCIFPYRGIYNEFKCRLIGIDTPEIRNKNLREKELGIKARDELRKLVLNKVVTLSLFEFDKYGRVLVDISIEGIKSISTWMIDKGYANKYNGGQKKDFLIF